MSGRWTDTLCVHDDLLNGGLVFAGSSCDMIGISTIFFSHILWLFSNLFVIGVFARVVFWCTNGNFRFVASVVSLEVVDGLLIYTLVGVLCLFMVL